MKKAINKSLYNFNSVFPAKLRQLMEEHGATQDKVAEICDVKRQTVAQWKDGNTCPDIISLQKISEMFNVSADWLLENPDFSATFELTGERIAKLRTQMGLTQKQLAEKLHTSREMVNYWENGNRRINTNDVINLAKITGVSADWLLGLSDNPTTDEATKSLCKTLGLSDVAIEFLQNDTTNQMRSKINFIFENLNEINNLYRKFEKEGTNE